jgi:GntR family transcriptional regulator
VIAGRYAWLMIDPTGPVPPYRQIAEIIRRQIQAGQLTKGARITESEICEEYEVARNTARRALSVLRDDGLVYTVPQRGTYVL